MSMREIPKVANAAVRQLAAETIAKNLKADCEVEGTVEEIAADIVKYCRDGFGDGYQFARQLEQGAHWECDMQIAEALDMYPHEIRKHLEKHQKDFELCYKIEPPLPVGTRVKCRHGAGVIESIYEYRPLTYAIKADEETTTRRWLLYYDEVEAIGEP